MSISAVNPILSPVAVQATLGVVERDLVLQPGTVIDAKVLQVLANNMVRIAIAGLSLDVMSQVPLQAGQALQLAVSQTESGIKLAMVGQGADTADASADSVTLAPGARADANLPAASALPKNVLTPLEKLAVSTAVQTAATQQGSLAPLFADAAVAAGSKTLPPQLQLAVAQLLAQRTSLDQNLTGGEVKNAFQKSGLFLEASLASGSPPAGIPDLKAALIVLRQTLLSSLGGASSPAQAAASPLAPSLAPDLDVADMLMAQARAGAAGDPQGSSAGSRAATTAALNLLQEGMQETGNAAPAMASPKELRNGGDVPLHTSTPPPFRGAQPSAQPVALPSLPTDAPLATTARHLLGDTEAAIARQTLLQAASLPDRIDTSSAPRTDPAAPRWHFEIPFATPQGTAMAEFEISRDGGGSEVEAAKRIWQARFSLDVEPAGPVHALVSLVGDTTSVRMWAERPETAAQLRAGAAQLSQALTRAELQPGDIVIGDGRPPQSAPAPAGHFLDRAL
jgi:hypothetical protein